MEKTAFRTALMARLDETGLSVKEVTVRAGLPYDRVYNIVKREDASTAVETAVAIARGFGLTVEEFVNVNGNKAVATPSDAAKLVEDAVVDVLSRLVGGEIIRGMSIPPEYAATLVRGVWQRRSQRPDTTDAEIAKYLTDELDLLTGGKKKPAERPIKITGVEDVVSKTTPPCKPH